MLHVSVLFDEENYLQSNENMDIRYTHLRAIHTQWPAKYWHFIVLKSGQMNKLCYKIVWIKVQLKCKKKKKQYQNVSKLKSELFLVKYFEFKCIQKFKQT